MPKLGPFDCGILWFGPPYRPGRGDFFKMQNLTNKTALVNQIEVVLYLF